MNEYWMRQYWLPFKAHALKYPFFFVWNEQQFPTEAAYCWTTAAPNANAYASVGFMNGNLSTHALTELTP